MAELLVAGRMRLVGGAGESRADTDTRWDAAVPAWEPMFDDPLGALARG
ncbi:hypothetical protein ACH3Y9_06920 [Streptomyces sp. WSLK1-5]